MKKIILAVVLILTLAFTATACEFSATTANLQNVQTASEVDESTYAPITVTDTFTTTSPYFFVTGDINNAPEDTVVSIEWYYAGDFIDKVDYTPVQTTEAIVFSLTKGDMNWPVGEYEAKLSIDDELKETVNFSVQ